LVYFAISSALSASTPPPQPRLNILFDSDKWVLMALEACGVTEEIRNLGDVKWVATEDGSAGKGTGRWIACFIFRPSNTEDKRG